MTRRERGCIRTGARGAARLARGSQHLLGLLLLTWLACASKLSLATLRVKQGEVERDHREQLLAWQVADVGTSFGLGDGVQTLEAASALLLLDEGAQLSMESDTLIRFSDRAPDERTLAFDVELGAASVFADKGELSIQTGGGVARIAPGTRVRLAHSPTGLHFVVQIGQAVLGGFGALEVGEGVIIDAGGMLRRIGPPEPELAAPAPSTESSSGVDPPEAGQVMAHVKGRSAKIHTESGWSALPEGSSSLSPGSQLQLGRGTTVELERGDERATLHQNGRFVVARRAGVLAAATGSLSAGSLAPVRIEVPGGVIVVAAGGRATVEPLDKGTRIQVQAREALVESERGTERITAGERALLEADGSVSIQGRSLDYADIEIAAGDSLVIHDPTPPTAVRFLLGDVCSEGGVLQLFSAGKAGQYAAGATAVALAMKTGTYRYELRCGSVGGNTVRSGRVTVQKDTGTRALAVHPPSASLHADGLSYTVMYQNRLPEIALAWPSPPSGKEVRLVHAFNGDTSTTALTEPSHVFASGSLEEGTHMFHFVGGGKISRETAVNIVFDNAAPTASLNTPAVVPAKPGDRVTISGTALPDWEVAIDGEPAQRDRQGRFSSLVTLPLTRRALAIRLSHRERGSHVYLRRGTP